MSQGEIARRFEKTEENPAMVRRGEKFFQSLLEVVRDGILLIDGAGTLHYSNCRARELLGMGDEPSPLPLQRYAPEIAAQLGPDFDPKVSQICEMAISYPERRLLRIACLPFGKNLRALVIQDRTEEEKKNSSALESEAFSAAQLLAGSMVHEIGNPLNAIKIQLQLLQRQIGGRKRLESLAPSLDICRSELDRIHGIISGFLDSFRQVRPVLRELRLGEVLAYCLRVQRAELEGKAITLNLHLNGESPIILGDGGLIQQAIFNVLRNAMEAMVAGGELKIRLHSDGIFASLEIEDNGAGISHQALPRLLQPHFSTKTFGHGLGLLVVQRTVQAHGGILTIRSLDPGTSVSLRFPLKDPSFPRLHAVPFPALPD
jgi:signal transduction histidine kinase